jgi:hypothetical protein
MSAMVFRKKNFFTFFGNPNEPFRAGFGPKVKNFIRPWAKTFINDYFLFFEMFSTIFMLKVRGLTQFSIKYFRNRQNGFFYHIKIKN